MAADFFVVPTATGCLLFVLVMLAHQRRRVVHVAVTAHPTAAWTARDLAFAAVGNTANAMDIIEVLTAPRSPWQNGLLRIRFSTRSPSVED